MSKRAIASKFVKKPIELFEMINYSARFDNEINTVFRDAKVFNHRLKLHEHISDTVGEGPIDYLEFGVWKGATFLKWMEMNQNSQSRFAGFDSFEGLPEDWVLGQPKGTFSTEGITPTIEDARGQFVKGWFQDTLYGFLNTFSPHNQMIIHVDCDLYSSTLFVLSALDRHMPDGTIIIFDDFSSMTHEFAAWLDYRRSFSRNWAPVAITQHGIQAAVRLQV